MAGILIQLAFHRVQKHPKQSSDEEVMVVRSWRTTIEKMIIVSHLRISVLCTLTEFLSSKMSEFGYTNFIEICFPMSLVYPTI